MNRNELLKSILEVINNIKFTAFDTENTQSSAYLGGDLGIDSASMLEVWYDLEQVLNIRVEDHEKRDLYTLDDVIALIETKLELVVASQ